MIIEKPEISSDTISFPVSETINIIGDAFGDPTHPIVILLHGGGQTRHSWGDTAIEIAKNGWYALALDARGHGDSSWGPSDEYSYDYLAADLKVIIEQLPSKPILVGASMGGITSLLIAGEIAPNIAQALVLVDIAPKIEQKGIDRIFTFMSAHTNGFESIEKAAEEVAKYLPHRPKPSENSKLEKNLRLRDDGRYYWHWDPAILENWKKITPDLKIKMEKRQFEAAKCLEIPTLIIRGAVSDVVSEKVMEEFLTTVPHVKAITVANAGHMVAGDSNHTFTNTVLAFMNEFKNN
jgi:pimeloyl-ACP methyl ester carboxylesterase